MILSLILLGICSITIIIDSLLIFFWLVNKKENYTNNQINRPKVSILIAARNEEDNVARCIESLARLDYPENKLEILIGDDDSEDQTLSILQELAEKHQNIHVFSITKIMGKAKGKANVLAHLAKEATGDYFFITDADVAVPQTWIEGMLLGQKPGVGIVTGVTAIENSHYQNTDWLFALGMVKVITDLNHPVTAMGNNMYVTRAAYESVGGYESIPFSITEDFELFKQVTSKGFTAIQIYDAQVLAKSKAIKGFGNLLNQRKRWMFGAVQLPFSIVILLAFQALYYPALFALILLAPLWVAIIFVTKLTLQTIFIAGLHKRLQLNVNWLVFFSYEFYSLILSLSSSVFFLIPMKIKWKGRKY